MSVLKLHLSVDLEQKVGELVISITSCSSIIILENTLSQCAEKNVAMVTLTTDIMFLLFTCTHFWVRGMLRRWSACGRPPMKWTVFAENLITALKG
jgi:hypothetical protein